ncbi:MAG: copper resistance CopC family protein [Mycobacteriaceae bacterium]
MRVVLAALTAAALATTAPMASAHTVLTATDPAADSTVNSGPSRVTATFNEELQPTFVAMTVVGPDGNLWSQGDATVQGATATVGLRPLGPSGRYTVNYRVTSDDGHVVSGSWSFTVTVPSTGTPGPAVQTPAQRDRIPLWPFIVGAAVLITGAAVWGLRRRP